MQETEPFSQLIVAAPKKTGNDGVTAGDVSSEAFQVFRHYLNRFATNANTPLADFLSTGLPYHLPFSVETAVANRMAEELRQYGWRVMLVPSAWG